MKITIPLNSNKMRNIMSSLAEEIAKDYIMKNILEIVQKECPEIKMSGIASLRFFETKKTRDDKKLGVIKGKTGIRTILGWCGDLVVILNDKIHGKTAIIFEIKYGKGTLTNGQEKFFEWVREDNPSTFMKKLDRIKIFKVITRRLDLTFREMDIYFEDLGGSPC